MAVPAVPKAVSRLTKWICACAHHTTCGFMCLLQILNCIRLQQLQIYTIRRTEKEEVSVSQLLRDFEKREYHLNVGKIKLKTSLPEAIMWPPLTGIFNPQNISSSDRHLKQVTGLCPRKIYSFPLPIKRNPDDQLRFRYVELSELRRFHHKKIRLFALLFKQGIKTLCFCKESLSAWQTILVLQCRKMVSSGTSRLQRSPHSCNSLKDTTCEQSLQA